MTKPKTKEPAKKKAALYPHPAPAVAKKILAFIRRGNTLETSAGVAGVHKDSLLDWLARGRRVGTKEEQPGDADYSEFCNQVYFAKCEAEALVFDTIRKTMGGPASGPGAKNWQAGAWWIVRRNPKAWAPPTKTQITGPNGGPIQTVDMTKLSDDELRQAIEGTLRPAGNGPEDD